VHGGSGLEGEAPSSAPLMWLSAALFARLTNQRRTWTFATRVPLQWAAWTWRARSCGGSFDPSIAG
jgi:hypothetical protein